MVVFCKSGCIRAKVVLFMQSCYIWAKVVVSGQSSCIRAKMVELGRKWLHWGKLVVFGQKCLHSGKIGCIRTKVVVLGQKWFYSGKLVVLLSQLLTTFLTPFGRYCYQRMCFGLKSAPEVFQRKMQTELQGIEGVICIMDDVLINGKLQAEHDDRRIQPFLPE